MMQETEDGREVEVGSGLEQAPEFDPADFEPRPFSVPDRRRAMWVVGVLAALVLMAVLPPLINVNRFRRQIATSISRSLGRPVHMDAVTLNMLPMPGFTMENFVVGEDPAFGTEPVIHANTVRATLRVRSLWRRRVEFSRISLTDTSVNLVHRADGQWNVESILLQASRIEAAPTAQAQAGYVPRFPYIEATGARVNVKMGLEKMPLSLIDGEFALWLPKPEQWRLRLEGHPARTDTAAMNTGTLRVQGTLGKAGTLAEVPVELAAEWTAAPLGAVSWVVMGRDGGLRGEMTLRASVAGTMGNNALESRLELRGLRRTDFVPAQTIDVDVGCKGQAMEVFHRMGEVQCSWPAGAAGSGVMVTGKVPELLQPRTAALDAEVRNVPAGVLLAGLRVASARVAPELTLGGKIAGSFASAERAGSMTIEQARLALGGGAPFVEQDVTGTTADGRLELGPVDVALGGAATLTGHLDAAGYGMHLSGTVLRSRLMAMAAALPQFGDGLEEALPAAPESGAAVGGPGVEETTIRVDLVSSRAWGGGQVWTAMPAKAVNGKKVRRR